jgi:hypothetical protein
VAFVTSAARSMVSRSSVVCCLWFLWDMPSSTITGSYGCSFFSFFYVLLYCKFWFPSFSTLVQRFNNKHNKHNYIHSTVLLDRHFIKRYKLQFHNPIMTMGWTSKRMTFICEQSSCAYVKLTCYYNYKIFYVSLTITKTKCIELNM